MTFRGRARKNPEHSFQAHTLKPFLDLALPRDAFWTAIDHSGGGQLLGALRKAKGAKDGLPDVLIFWSHRGYGMELKAGNGRVQDNQIECSRRLSLAGIPVWTVRTLRDAQDALHSWGIPLRAHLDHSQPPPRPLQRTPEP